MNAVIARMTLCPVRQISAPKSIRLICRCVPCGAVGWRIETHAAWTDAERAAWIQQLRIDGVTPVEFESSPAISAGFRVVSGNNVLDATIEGLLADRTQIEGRLLHHLQQENA